MATAYTTLGVAENASQEQIAEAFRLRCAEWHPDRAKDDVDRAARTAKMARLTLAKRYLGDPEARARYDRRLADLAARAPCSNPSPAPSNPETLEHFLQQLETGAPGNAVADFARQAALANRASYEKIQAASAKGADVAKGVVELIGLVRGYQR